MLKKITKWETEDGKVFDTQEEAEDFVFEQESQIAAQQAEHKAAPADTTAAWVRPVSELLGHISDVLPDNAFNKIDTAKWNAVSALVGATTQAADAPVVLPEPAAWMLGCQTMGGGVGWKLSFSQPGAGVCQRLKGEEFEERLYTEQQVMDILKSAGGPVKQR